MSAESSGGGLRGGPHLYLPPSAEEEGLGDTSVYIMCVNLGHFVAGSLFRQTVAERFCPVGLCLQHGGMIVLMFGMCQGTKEPQTTRLIQTGAVTDGSLGDGPHWDGFPRSRE